MATGPDLSQVTPEQAELLMVSLMDEIRAIESQLGDQNRTVDGQRMAADEWNRWRFAAKHALRAKTTQYKALKTYVGQVKRREHAAKGPVIDQAYSVIKRLTDVYRAAVVHVEEETDDTFERLVEALEACGGYQWPGHNKRDEVAG